MQDGTLPDLFFSTPALPSSPDKREKASRPVRGVVHGLRNHPAGGRRDIGEAPFSEPRFRADTQERFYGCFLVLQGKQPVTPRTVRRNSRSDNRRWIYQTMLNVKHNFTTGQTRRIRVFLFPMPLAFTSLDDVCPCRMHT